MSFSQLDNKLTPASVWILQNYLQLETNLIRYGENYELAHSIESLYKFLWDKYADWYVEYLKTDTSQLAFARELFRQYVQILYPYSPFETEALWGQFFGEQELLAFQLKEKNLAKSVYENLDDQTKQSSSEFEMVIAFVISLRSLRGLFAIDPATGVEIFTQSEVLLKYRKFVSLVAKGKLINLRKPEFYTINQAKFSYSIDILSYIQDLPKEISRTEKLLAKIQAQISALQNQLANPAFLNNAAEEVVSKKKSDLDERQTEIQEQKLKLEFLKNKNNPALPSTVKSTFNFKSQTLT